MRQGRIGLAESVCLTALSLYVNGVFALDAKSAYSEGNLTYLSLPLSVLVSLIVVSFAVRAAENRSAGDLSELLGRGVFGTAAAILLALSMTLAAAKPLGVFEQIMHTLVFDGASSESILLFIIPVIVFCAWKGFESIGRAALLFSGTILVSVAIAAASASSEFSTSRLYPFPGQDAAGFFFSVYRGTFGFIPPLAALLVNAKGLNGTGPVKRASVSGALIAAAAVGLTQLAVALIYPAGVLKGLLLPLGRINFLTLSRSYALRLDKLFIMIWLNGCMISAAYLIYSSALLLAKSFGANDIRPFIPVCALTVTVFSSLGFICRLKTAEFVDFAAANFGPVAAAAPLAAALFRRPGMGRRAKA